MATNLPLGYWLNSQDNKHVCIGFQYGGHMGGECEIYLPINKLEKFCLDNSWREKTVNEFYKIVFLGTPEMNIPIPTSEVDRDGIVPESWE